MAMVHRPAELAAKKFCAATGSAWPAEHPQALLQRRSGKAPLLTPRVRVTLPRTTLRVCSPPCRRARSGLRAQGPLCTQGPFPRRIRRVI